MARQSYSGQLTPLELEIMKALWQLGPSSVQAVQEHLSAERPLAYNTVQTMLNVLHRKGKVQRAMEGRAYLYEPVVSRLQAAQLAAADLVSRMFDGSAENLVLSLVETKQLTPETLARLTEMVDPIEAARGGAAQVDPIEAAHGGAAPVDPIEAARGGMAHAGAAGEQAGEEDDHEDR